MSQEETIDILEQLLRSVKVRGLKKTLNIIKVDHDNSSLILDEKVNYILDCVSKAFSISQNEIFNSRYVRGDIKYAIGFSVYYLYQEKTLGEIAKTVFKNKNKTLLSKYRQMICDLNELHISDAKYLKIKKELDSLIENK
jgi:hypothetical protein